MERARLEAGEARRPWTNDALWFVGVAIAGVMYAMARAEFTHEYSAVPWSKLLSLTAPLPFGHRVLVPWLAGPLVNAGVSPAWIFGAVEAVSFVAVVTFTAAALLCWLPRARARLGASLIGLSLPLVYVLPRRWPLQYPWDGPALAVLAIALWAATQRRYRLAWIVCTLGALNRETAILVPLILLALVVHDQAQRRVAVAWAELMLAACLAVRVLVALALPDNPGPPLHFTVGDAEYRVIANLQWLAAPSHWAWLVLYLGVLPLLWPLRRRFIPRPLHRIGLLGVAYFVAALVVANVYEPRAWGEAVYLASVPAIVGLLAHGVADPTVPPRWLGVLDRYGALALAITFALFVVALRTWAFLPVAQWPMPR